MSHNTPIPERLKEARTLAGLSQKELGIRAGIDEFSASPRINHYEKGRHLPDYTMVERMADVLGVPVPYFYASDEVMAEIVLLAGRMPTGERQKLLEALRLRR